MSANNLWYAEYRKMRDERDRLREIIDFLKSTGCYRHVEEVERRAAERADRLRS